MQDLDPATAIMLKQNIEEALTDVSSVNRKIDVLPAKSGEKITKYIKEITDDETVESLEGITVGEDDKQLRLQVNKNDERLEKLTLELNKVVVTMAGGNGAKGYVERTEDAICDLKKDMHCGFDALNGSWSDFEKILMDMVKGLKKETEDNTDSITNHETRIKALEHERDMRANNSLFVKRTIIGAALGGSGLTGIIFMLIKKGAM